MKISRTGLSLTAALTLTTTLVSPIWAQDTPARRGVLSFSAGLEASDNPTFQSSGGDTVISSRNELGFAIISETRTELFRLGVDAVSEIDIAGDSEDDGFRLISQGGSLRYRRQGANSELSFSARYREADLEDETFGFFVDGVFDPDALVIDGGSRRATNVRGSIEFGKEGPFGFELSASARDSDFIDAVDPELIDSETYSVDAVARFRINPALTARVTAGVEQETEGDIGNTEREVTYIGAGLEGELGTGVSYSGTLTFDQSETTNSGAVIREDDGVGVQVSVTQLRGDGNLSFGASSRIDEVGRLTTATVRRSYDLPLGGLSVSLGVIDRDDESVRITAGLGYLRETPRGALSANLVQEPSTDDGNAIINTRLSVGYEEAINQVSGWDASLDFSSLDELGGGSDDSRTSASIAYNRQLTDDWGLRTGFRHSRISEDGGDTRSSNTVFFNIERDITFGF